MSNIAEKKQKSTAYNIIAVITGALLMGLLWSIRGTHGWGSSWGLLNVGFIFTAYIICLLGGRKKLGLGWLAITSISFMVTTPAWGTIIVQINGILKEKSGDSTAYVSAFSAVFLMLCLGFGVAALYGLLLGRAYSDVKWKMKDCFKVLIAFFAAGIIARLTVSILILNLVQPEAQSLFKEGLYKAGIQDPGWLAYIKHFGNEAWAKEIEGGRNYFASIKAISSAVSAVAAILTTKYVIKDDRAAKIGTAVCFAFAFAITVSDLFFFFGHGGWHEIQGFSLPEFIDARSMWEYSTGFVAGGIITAVMIKMKPAEDVDDLFVDDVPSTIKEIMTFLVGYVVLIMVNMVRPVMERYENSIRQMQFVIITAVASIVIVAVIALLCGINVNKVDMRYYAAIMLVLTLIYNYPMYMFFGTKEHMAVNEIGMLHNILITASFVLVLIWATVNFFKARKLKYENINNMR